MYNILTLNKIAAIGTSRLGDNYKYGDDVQNPDAVLVRSAAMHDMEFADNLLAIARAGAGTNNIPKDKCSEQGIVVFNTPGANANAVKELVIAGLLISNRKVIEGYEWAKTLKGNGAAVGKMVEKGKSQFVGPEIKGKTLGVIGLGAIGILVANAAVALGMNVIGFDPFMSVGNALKLAPTVEELLPKQHFTQPPAHYTEASLVKTLEELGIGRPSTYSPTISTILARRYITKESKNLYVTEIGEVVNSIMKESFPTIVDEHFTANMESLLDAVAEGKVNWKTVVENFYPDLKEAIDKAENELEKVTIHDEVTDEICPECGRNLVIKYGPHGKFLACPGFPDCRFTMPYLEKIGVNCPKCGKDVVLKKTRKGRKYYGCIDNPECDFMSWGRPVAEKCPRCGGYMIVKGNKIACADEQCGYVTDKKPEREE